MVLFLYLLRQLAVSIGFSLGAISLLVIPSVAIQAVYALGGVGLQAVLSYLPLALIELVPYVLPMSFLLGVVATFGRLEVDQELTAVRMAGIHPLRLLVPGLVIALPLVVGTNWLLAEISPAWKFARRDFARRAQEDAFRQLSHTRGELDFGEFYLRYGRQEGGHRFYEAILGVPQVDDEELTVVADWVELSFEGDVLVARLSAAQVLSGSGEFESAAPVVRLPLDQLVKSRPKSRDHAKFMTTRELQETLRSGELNAKKREEFIYNVHARHALSLTYLVFLLLGVPTGTFLRTGTQLGAFTGAVGYAILYYVLSLRLGKELASESAVSVVAAAWATDGLFLFVGVWLSIKALWR